MQNHSFFEQNGGLWPVPQWRHVDTRVGRRGAIALLLIVSLFAFELFNYDTTRFALSNLLGDVSFVGFRWAAILAIAFCAIDFAGLAYLFAPDRNGEGDQEAWYLMGAWLLGATMNALMTWWAVSLTLLSHDFGNEVLSRQQLLEIVPPFVAVLVWLTRILFIGAFSAAGNHFFAGSGQRPMSGDRRRPHPATHSKTLATPPVVRREPRPQTPAPVRPASLRMSASGRRRE